MKLFAIVALALTSSANAFTVSPMHVTARAPMAAERPAFAAREGRHLPLPNAQGKESPWTPVATPSEVCL